LHSSLVLTQVEQHLVPQSMVRLLALLPNISLPWNNSLGTISQAHLSPLSVMVEICLITLTPARGSHMYTVIVR
jgi:hypothetical protein